MTALSRRSKLHTGRFTISNKRSIKKLTFADTCSVHHPNERRAVLAVCGNAVLSGLENVTQVLLHLQGPTEISSELSVQGSTDKHTIQCFTRYNGSKHSAKRKEELKIANSKEMSHNVCLLFPSLLAFWFGSL